MSAVVVTAVSSFLVVLAIAVTVLFVVRTALAGTDSRDRARILHAVAEVARAVRGKK